MNPSFDASRVRALCFDIDGTLLETDDVLVERLERLLPLGPAGRRHAAARRLVMAAESPANALLTWIDRLGMDEVLAPFLDRLHRWRGLGAVDAFRPVEGSMAAVRRLAEHYPIALITAREQRTVRAFLRTFRLDPLVAQVATARTTRRAKPHPAPVLWVAKRLGVPPTACLVVGDTTVDIRAGRAAGAQTVGVLCGFGEREELERAGADLILASVAELPRFLLGA